ncbi:MAG: hypothetical protein IIA61_02610 [Candidatus Marinimicrobia bacterium]|nr:hypothetical protein [Candidatus Neomarinimicrobiota bacterium]
MCAKWIKKIQPNQITKKLEKIKTVKDGKVSFSEFEYHEYQAVLESMVEFHTNIPIHLKRNILREGVKQAAIRGTINPDTLIASISKKENEYLCRTPKPYIMATYITIQNNVNLPSVKLHNTHINFTRYLPNQFVIKRTESEKKAESIINSKTPKNSIAVRIRVKAKEEHDAAHIALDSIDFYRSLINFVTTSSFRMTFGGPSKPVNEVLLGPVHTLHNLSGNLATQLFWYQSDFTLTKTVNIANKKEALLKNIKYIRGKMKRLQYSSELRNIFLRYVRALDYPDYNTAFIHLWGVLEILTYTKYSGYDVTIKRAASMFKEFDYHKQVLNHLRIYRNSLIHSGKAYNDIEPYIYQLKRYIDQLLWFFIHNSFGFISIEKAAEFMDIPQDINELNKNHSLIHAAMKFRNISTIKIK